MTGFPFISLVNRAVKLTSVTGPLVRVALEQRKADTGTVLKDPALALIDAGKGRKGQVGTPRRVVSYMQHGHVQLVVRHHLGDVSDSTIAGTHHTKPGGRRACGLIA